MTNPDTDSVRPGKIRIMLVEDDPMMQSVTAISLRMENFEILTCSNGAEATTAVHDFKPDLILSDIRMPVVDGLQLLQAIRADPKLHFLPFILMSAKAESADQRMGMSLGADDYVVKPFETTDLIRTIALRLERADHMRRIESEQRRFFSRIVPHELRTPLVAIIGYGDLLAHTGASGGSLTSAELLRYGQDLLRSGHRLLKLSDNCHLWGWMERQFVLQHQGHLPDVKCRRLAPSELSRLCLECEADHGREGDLRQRFESAEISALGEGLETTLRNLVENAFKFSLPGSVVNVVGEVCGPHYRFEITDRGRGMTSAQVAQIAPLRQFDRNSFEQQGVGLGLALALRFSALSGGTLELGSNPDGVGLRAVLSLPLHAG